LILRQSVEQRNADLREEAEKRLSLDAERNRNLQEEAERRLKLEAAIRAVALLGTNTGGDTNLLQRTGVLFSLSHLGMIDLAIDLVHLMSPNGLIEARATASLLDIALRSTDPNVKKNAAEFLRDHSDILFTEKGVEWPNYLLLSWPQELDFLARNYLLEGMMNAILSHPRSEWHFGGLNAAVVRLVVAFREEQDPRLKAGMALFLQNLLKIYPSGAIIYLPEENLQIDNVYKEVANTDCSMANILSTKLSNNLRDWLGDQDIDGRENDDV